MKYKLINTNTKEVTLCNKVTIDGFDYYVNDFISDEVNGDLTKIPFEKLMLIAVASNNPNIDIPKVVNEVEIMANLYCKEMDRLAESHDFNSFKYAYNKSQETHPFSLDDVKKIISLAREQYWDIDNRGFSSNTEGDWSFKYSTEDEIIQKYQEIKLLKIFYE